MKNKFARYNLQMAFIYVSQIYQPITLLTVERFCCSLFYNGRKSNDAALEKHPELSSAFIWGG